MMFLLGAGSLILGVANAQQTEKPAAAATSFQVYNFSAGAIPRSNLGYIEFSWSYNRGANITGCNGYPTDKSTFPFIAQTLCEDRTASFNTTTTADGGSDLRLWHEVSPGQFEVATHHIPPGDIMETTQQFSMGKVPVYSGPRNFTIEPVYKQALNITFGPAPTR